MVSNILRIFLTIINLLIPKNKSRVIFYCFPNTETSSINTANFITNNYPNLEVNIVFDKNGAVIPYNLVDNKVRIILRNNSFSLMPILKLLTSKYVFFTHGIFLKKFSKSQIVVNLWHGLMYKKIGLLLGKEPILTNLVVGTSEISQQMFSDAFGVEKSKITTTGYPRNDVLINTKNEKDLLIHKLNLPLNINKIILWMPTYRKSRIDEYHEDGVDVGNPFYINNFDIYKFDEILLKHNAICFVKPHPLAPIFEVEKNKIQSIKFIDDKWINNKDLDLYQFVGLTDILISDVSSIIFDYMLLDNPIICISEDFEEYKKNRGYYFDNIEEMLPTKVLKNQNELFESVNKILTENVDIYELKRKKLKSYFFDYHDSNSTMRLINLIFKK